ncbi:EcsC family protein [Acinetobacter rathckeae]|uniref:EcsC family protein n=1 Tax=Acinetobacter rathckeae TaxID=2605272 RepID=UPI0018A25D93|nr:EcsC family protein [Acinetobacter rathckeae]MBF7688838.1 EcsC family protein [Acinetobacter rathckeae]
MQYQVDEPAVSKASQVLRVAKKLKGYGLVQYKRWEQKNKLQPYYSLGDQPAIEGHATDKTYANMQNMMRHYVPNVSQQLLGRRFGQVTKAVGFLSPIGLDQIADYLFTQLNTYAIHLSKVQAILEETGIKSLQALASDPSRSGRIAQALGEQNKWFSCAQGGFAALFGTMGAVADLPLTLLFALKTVYQTGHAYGFELKDEEQDLLALIFEHIEFDQIAQKQAILLAIRSLSRVLEHNDFEGLQQFLGSNNDFTWLTDFIKSQQDESHWSWLVQLPALGWLSKVTPLALVGVSAVYNWKFIDHVSAQSQHVFAVVRNYQQQHYAENLTALQAYHAAKQNDHFVSKIAH